MTDHLSHRSRIEARDRAIWSSGWGLVNKHKNLTGLSAMCCALHIKGCDFIWGGETVPILLYIKHKFCKKIGSIGSSPYDWPEGEETEPWLTARNPCQSITRHLLKTAYESVERHTVKSHLRTTGHRLVGTCQRQGFWASSILMCCKNVEFWKMGGRSRLGHSDLSSCSGRSHRKISHVGRSYDGAIVRHFYHLQHEWVTCLCSGHWLIVKSMDPGSLMVRIQKVGLGHVSLIDYE
jgi:hypothetical protein